MMNVLYQNGDRYCSFCGSNRNGAVALGTSASIDVYICGSCVEEAKEALLTDRLLTILERRNQKGGV